ncbi:MAG: N-6 DNA methylase, partial [Bacteroidales bacterium]|nr:N-6 DNA methylase [Bacteroidales bacterium]
DILKSEFGLNDGLADISKTKIKIKDVTKATADLRSKTKTIEREEEVHRVQILDPAAGTGTFLAEIVKHIYKRFEGQQGIWNDYVEKQLIPRLNGFEILMASYAMAHLKLDMLLNETGFKTQKEQRFRVYLTNSLEEHHPDTGTLFANWLSSEANEANHIKRDTPVMVVLGNPPYSVSSSNKGKWIQNLITDYKKDLNEKKLNLDDDYIKFIRYGQHFIDKNGSGILAYISNNSFIDGITHRQMRKNLLDSFDKIYILDLHGSAKKQEKTLDGRKDENVFDIQQGVSINIFIKTSVKKKKDLAQVFHFDLFGNRESKYSTLIDNSINSIEFKKLSLERPYYFYVPKQLTDKKYNSWFSINDIFLNVNNGIKTDRDPLFIGETRVDIENRFKILLSGELSKSFIDEYRVLNSGSFKITDRIKYKTYNSDYIKNILYRPFDVRYIYYDPQIVSRPAQKVMQHMLQENIALLCCRQQSTFDFQHILVSKVLSEVCTVSLQTKETTYVFPLFLYPEITNQLTLGHKIEKINNLNSKIVKQIEVKINITFTPEKENTENTFAPIDILDYIYAVLHNPTYREKYKEFLKIDFPKVPYPKDKETFWQLVKLGGELRQIHLLESSTVEKRITTYPTTGSNQVEKPSFENGKVWINDEQYFDGVPKIAWEFYIGGYQPAQKWLKDRKGRVLSFEDILHYQKIIVALTETDRIMKEIDKIKIE